VASGDPKTDVLAWIRRDFRKDDFVSLTYDLAFKVARASIVVGELLSQLKCRSDRRRAARC
jgi:hypothetical protein